MAIRVNKRKEIQAGDKLVDVFLEQEDRTPLKVAVIIALVAHTLLLGIVFPTFKRSAAAGETEKRVYVLRPYVPPPEQKKIRQTQLEKVRKVALPDPTPEEPEPIREPEPEPELPPLPEDAEILFGIPEGPPAPQPMRVGMAGFTEPKKIKEVLPQYPPLARAAQFEGEVVLDILIDEEGRVADIKVLKGMAMGLTEAAIDAVEQWRYEPSHQYGRPVPVLMTVRVKFQFHD
jgi:TonB family protein